MSANQRQVGGTHYQRGPNKKQHWDMVAEFGLDYFQGQITKYLFRWEDKGGVEDLKKARHYLDKYIELAESRRNQMTAMKVGDHARTDTEGERIP